MKLDKEFEVQKKCDLCKIEQTKPCFEVPDRNYGTGNFTYIQCKKCGLIWLSPRPKEKYLADFYPSRYPAYKRIKKIGSVQQIVRIILKKYSLLAKLFIRDELYFLNPKGKILDVGTGNGSYMQIMEKWGWQAYGVEINPQTVIRAKKEGVKNIKCGNLMKVHYPDLFFDVVRFSHVLEHVASPAKELKETWRILKCGGRVVISLPNIGSIFFKIFGSFWYPLEAPRHFFHFSAKTITMMLEEQGFINIKIHYNQSPYPPIWSLSYMLGQSNVEWRNIFFGFPVGFLLKICNLLKVSDILEVTASKP